ncbi:MAG: hypothetical protein ACRDD7_06285 [Peptostreptococcaceae bacterium]
MAINKGYLTSDTSIKGDECYSPYYCIDPLLEFIPKNKIIWCPFDEEWSAFYQTFKRGGWNVVRSHIKDGQDFFKYEPDEWDILISNPPFSKKDEVLKRCYEFGKPFALLLPANSIQGKARYKLFKRGIEMLCFDGRVAFHTNDNFKEYTRGTAFASAYFCKDLLPEKLILKELKEYQKALK